MNRAFKNAFCYVIFSLFLSFPMLSQGGEMDALIQQLDSCFQLIQTGNVSEAEALMISTHKECEKFEDATFRFQSDIAYLNLFMMTNKYDLAIERGVGIIEKCKEDFGENSFEYSTVHNSMGILYQHDYQFGKALTHFNIALKIIREVFGTESFYSAGCLNNLGLIYSNIEQHEKAIAAFTESSNIYEKLIDDPKEKNRTQLNLAESYANLSTVLIKIGKIDQAKIYIANGLKVIESSSGKKGPKYAKLIMDMGTAFARNGELTKANDFFIQADELYDEMFSDFHEVKLSVKFKRFENLIELEQFDTCITVIASLQELLKEIPNDVTQKANFQHLMAIYHMKRGNYNLSSEQFDLAIASNIESPFKGAFHVDFIRCEASELQILIGEYSKAKTLLDSVSKRLNGITEMGIQRILLASEYEMASAYLSYNSKGPDYLTTTLEHVSNVDSLKVFFDDFYQSDENIINHNQRYQDIYNLGIHVCNQLFESRTAENYALEALSLMERSRASALMENISERQRLTDNKDFQLLSSIKSHIQKIELEIVDCQSVEEVIHLKNKSTRLWNEYFELRAKLNDESAFLYASAKETSKRLDRSIGDNLLLEFHCSDSIIYLIGASADRMDIRSMKKDAELSSLLTSWLGKITDVNSSLPEIETESKKLSSTLFGNFLTNFPNKGLIIIPHETLSLVPFEALPDCSKNDFEYLVSSRSITYGYSIALLDFSMRHNTVDCENDYVALTPNYESFVPDEYSKRYHNVKFSVESVTSTMEGLNGRLFSDEQANITNLSKYGNGSKIIHIVAHGYLNETNHLESGFILCGDTANKARLVSSKDVYQLDLKNDLTILNSCDAENGTLFDQEGLMSLSRAFLFAGSRSLATTKWSAPDESSAAITEMFLVNLQKGMDKSLALQNAKNDYLQNESIPRRMKHPFFWSSIVVIGNYQALDIQNTNFLFIGCIALLTLILARLIYIRMKKSKKLLSGFELSK